MFRTVMKTLVLSALFAFAFTVATSFAQGCPGGGCGGKDKSDKDKKKETNQTVAPYVAL